MNTFFLIFIGLPVVEIFLMIKIGGIIGAFYTIALILLTAIVGVFFARVQGIKTLQSGITNIYQNKVPVFELVSGASIAFAALLLIIPGFLTDLTGFLLLIPLTRHMILKIFFNKKTYVNKTRERNEAIDGEIVDKDKDKDEL